MKRNKIHRSTHGLRKCIAWVMMSFVAIGCNKTVDPDFSLIGHEYYPITNGAYRIYFTQIVNYNLDRSIDTTQYLTKEVVEDSVANTDGSYRFLLGRYSADIGSQKWHKDSLWAVQVTQHNVIVSEANEDYIKLSFPVKDNITWDGNARNSKDRELYEINDLDKSYSYDTLTYENTLTVIQSDLIDEHKITNDDYRIEVFAANVGLVYKLRNEINYCSKCTENGIIENGIIFEQKLIEFGKE